MSKYLRFLVKIGVIFTIMTSATHAGSPPKAIIEIQKGELEKEVPFSINLDGSASTDPEKGKLQYLWEYPDGETIETKNPRSHRFENPGIYDIKLTVTDVEGLSDIATMQIVAKEKIKKTKKTKSKKKPAKKKTKKSTNMSKIKDKSLKSNNLKESKSPKNPNETWTDYIAATVIILSITLLWLRGKMKRRS